ncbi:MAG: ABC transporter ATP-binding protein [Spirochaetaceae bacterium]|nr:ABC transporter ATP-binding protein [Spirochaetaceae bacterium]
MSEFLQIRNVTMKFGELLADKDVSFDVPKGMICGLIGPNGAGKTTLFNCIAGYYAPTAGEIFFEGKRISGLPPYRIARLGIARTFQVVRPLKEMSVLDNIMVGAFLHHASAAEARKAAERCLDLCFLEEYRNKPAGDLTIGNKKRLEVARALATNPKLLLLDECVAGLTSTEVHDMVQVIKRLRDEGITILMVEHIMEAIMPIADKIVVLSHGEKIAEGSPSVVVHDPMVITAYLGEKFARKLAEQKAAAGEGGAL